MQLLFQEFFRKLYDLSEGKTSLFLKFIVRFFLYLMLAILIGLIYYLYVAGKYVIILVILGVVMIGETAHYIRKLKEQKADSKIPKDSSKEHTKGMLKSGNSKNKGLLKGSESKNKELLKDRRLKKILPRNKSLLNVRGSKNKRLLRAKGLKNNDLLKVRKSKNKRLLRK